MRQLLISDIEEQTGRALLTYFTDCTSGAMIDPDDEPYLTELLGKCTADEFDLFLETNGGMTDATENVVSTLLNWGKPFRVVVPSKAKSNGTLVALAASAIVMGANSELGPIDPSLNGMPCTFIVQLRDAGEQVDPMLAKFADHAILQTRRLAKRLLSEGMMKGSDEDAVTATVDALASRAVYHSHGSVIDHNEASTLGLNVEYLLPESDLWRRFWLLRSMYAHDAARNGLAKVFESSSVGLSIATRSQ